MPPRNPTYLVLAAILLCSGPAISEDPGLILTVRVTGAAPGKGQAVMSVFTSAESFLKTPLIKKSKTIGPDGGAVFAVEIPTPGEYAVSVVYDEDGNGKLNTGFLGIPTEPVGMSNNAKGRFGPPKYKDAAFHIAASRTIQIRLDNAGD